MRILICILGLTLAVSGCAEEPLQESSDTHELNSWLVRTVNDTSVQNAIIRQHTLFPYHFIDYGKNLNDLGNHDLAVLVKHYQENPGPLNIRQGRTPRELYEARVESVMQIMTEAGLDIDRVSIGDGPAGGDGMDGEQVLVIMQRQNESSDSTSMDLSSFLPGVAK